MRTLVEADNGAVAIAGDSIVALEGQFDRRIRILGGIIQPGLINAHDHLRLNHFGRLGDGPYSNAYDWAADIQHRHATRIAAGRALSRRTALLCGAWKNLLCGVTTVVHHDFWETGF